ncbi:MAG: hypothetical protein ACRD3C_10245 [Vicinamibacterales bacterium]
MSAVVVFTAIWLSEGSNLWPLLLIVAAPVATVYLLGCGWWSAGSPAKGEAVFRIVQPYGRDRAHEATIISEHTTAAGAFAEIDRLSSEMVRTGAPSDAV